MRRQRNVILDPAHDDAKAPKYRFSIVPLGGVFCAESRITVH
jgi:hypothetical protein